RQDFIDQMQVAGIDTIGGDPAALSTALQEESRRVAVAAKRANLKAE
ncbi:MAG: tripartite tricarboxylate transporter substrate binding protein, partial [Burkholderiaceae bacterium]|nr:tripartite tricarboxylate transporter substrate binding protein [Burkholderiaceae bacterium]